MDAFHKHNERMKENTEEDLLNDSIYIKYKSSQNYMLETRLVFTHRAGSGGVCVNDWKRAEGSFWVLPVFCFFMCYWLSL